MSTTEPQGDRSAFVDALRIYGATEDEIAALADTDMAGVIDEDALAHQRLTALRHVPSAW